MIGKTLSHFEITAKLGEGGMGEVYRATDSKLGREVAIKVLSEEFVADPERLARFGREARLLAALNHSNIASIHEVGEDGGVHFLVMEFAPGQSLAERIAKGPMDMDEALPIALQVVAALEAAHAQGIVHRDLKPANIHVSDEGQVKVLDFGLAKALVSDLGAPADLTRSPTLTQLPTQAGVLLGTASYMSPEQARGREADARSDIWAFGVVLFEMLAGQRLFDGDTVSDCLAAVLRADVPTGDLPDHLPIPVRRVIRRCLEREVRRRLQHIGDARLDLEDALASPARDPDALTEPGPPPATSSFWVRVLAGATLLAGAVVLWALVWRQPDLAVEPRRSLIHIDEPLYAVSPPIIAPDGRKGLYATGDRLGMWSLDRFEQRIWEGEHAHPFFSPDSEHIGFEQEGALWRMNLASGQRRLITGMPGANLSGAVWSEDDTITFLTWFPQKLYRVAAEGGELEELTTPSEGSRELSGRLPDARGLLFVNFADGGIDILADGEWKAVLPGEDIAWAAWSPTGHLIYHRPEDGLWAVPFSLDTLRPTAGPVHLDPVGSWPTLSTRGRLSYKRSLDRARFVLTDRTGRIVAPIGRGQFMLQDPAVSPDGRTIAGVAREQGRFAIWLHEVDSGVARRLTFDHQPALGSATWYPDGRHLVFTTESELLKLDLQGEEPPEPVARGRTPHISHDGRYLVFVRPLEPSPADRATNDTQAPTHAIQYLDLTGDGEPKTFAEGRERFWRPRFSPDGRYLAYLSDASGRNEVYVRRFPSGGGPWQVSADGAAEPRWSAGGDELFFLQGRDVMAVPVPASPTFQSGEPRKLFTLTSPVFYEYAVTAEGQFVVVHPGESSSQIAVVDDWLSLPRNSER
jgi:serine/threonine protein kinase